jgi:S-adenosylmethionine hydrolase
MSSPIIITILTDFGIRDGYVAAMNGIILGINRNVTLVDISHEVPPRDVGHGAFVLGTTYQYFSPDAIHIAVVDPGVGTSRRALLVITPGGRFLAPDNGLLTYVMRAHFRPDTGDTSTGAGFMEPVETEVPRGCSAYELTEREYWRHPVSDTFHGRDIFAPVAAHLSLGLAPEKLGERIGEVSCLNIFPHARRGDILEGRILFVDRFGNLATNVRPSQVGANDLEVEIGGTRVRGLAVSFAEGEGLRVLVGSHGYLEIAEKNGSAALRLSASVGTQLTVRAAGARPAG